MPTVSNAVLRLGLSDVAQLAHVQRPVVSMWRARSAGTDNPFPTPVKKARGQEWFDGTAVVDWLIATGRGNNPSARDDLAAYASLDGGSPQGDQIVFDGITGLLCLSAITNRALGSMGRDDLIDLADEIDPDDDLLFGEIESLAARLEPLAHYTDLLVDAAFNAQAAFEQLMADRFRLYVPGHTTIALAKPARQLLARLAIAAADQLGLDEPTFVDPTNGGSDLLIAVAEQLADRPFAVSTAQGRDAASRLARRRIRVHGIQRSPLAGDGGGEQLTPERSVLIAQFPCPGSPSMKAVDILDRINLLTLETTDAHRVFVIGPAGVLTDSLASRDDRLARDAILRTDRLRTIVRLPQGLRTPRPRERMALLCFGSAATVRGSRDRTILTTDLSNVSLDAASVDDLVTDIVAGLGGPGGGSRRHPRFLRPVLVRRLLTRTGDLLDAGTMPGLTTTSGPDLVLRITEIAHIVGSPAHTDQAFVVEANIPGDQRPTETTVGSAVERGEIKIIAGHRLDPADLSPGGSVAVLGVEEIVGSAVTGQRRVDRLDFAARYPSGRSTEPGDVAFCTAPRPSAIVDDAGGSVVVYPARVARIMDPSSSAITPRMLAADINALPVSAKSLRNWAIRRVQPDQVCAVDRVLTDIHSHQRALTCQLRELDQLAALVATGAAAAVITISAPTDETPKGP